MKKKLLVIKDGFRSPQFTDTFGYHLVSLDEFLNNLNLSELESVSIASGTMTGSDCEKIAEKLNNSTFVPVVILTKNVDVAIKFVANIPNIVNFAPYNSLRVPHPEGFLEFC